MLKQRFITSLVIFVAGFTLSAVIGGRSLGFLSNSPEPAVAAQATRKISAPQAWEYLVVTQSAQDRSGDMEAELKIAGGKGYEVCGMSQSTLNNSAIHVTVVLRRPKR